MTERNSWNKKKNPARILTGFGLHCSLVPVVVVSTATTTTRAAILVVTE